MSAAKASAKKLNFIVMDLETTGLDARVDRIIEVGMVRLECTFSGAKMRHKVTDRYETLVNPGRELTPLIEQITGIRNQDLRKAPQWEAVQDEVADFVGETAIVGHNIAFDAGFLSEQGIPLEAQPHFDTYTLANILVADAPSYSLEVLADHFQLDLKDHHRALPDAEATAALWVALLDLIVQLDPKPLKTLFQLTRQHPWTYGQLFELAAGKTRFSPKETGEEAIASSDHVGGEVEGEADFAPEQVKAFFAEKGPLSALMTGYRERFEQVEMAQAVGEALAREDNLCVEAGTGVGKSLAYLVPGLMFSLAREEPMVVATYSHTLQMQLMEEALPLLREAWMRWPERPAQLPDNFRAALLKGRDNYLCTKRVEDFINRPQLGEEEMAFAVKLLLHLPRLRYGERDELPIARNEHRLWYQVSARHPFCHGTQCGGGLKFPCFYAQAWRQAEKANIVITNQANLLTSSRLSGDRFPWVVIDEAHHLEEVVTDQATVFLDEVELKEWTQQLGSKEKGRWSGLLGELSQLITRKPELEDTFAGIQREGQNLFRTSKKMFHDLKQLLIDGFGSGPDLGGRDREKPDDNTTWLTEQRITPALRGQSEWLTAEQSAESVQSALTAIRQGLEKIDSTFNLPADKPLQEALLDKLTTLKQFIAVLDDAVLSRARHDQITYLHLNPRTSTVRLNLAPLSPADPFDHLLLSHKKSVIFTSATLRSGEGFDYFTQTVGLTDRTAELSVNSPFDFVRQVQLYLPKPSHDRSHNQGQRLIREVLGLVEHFQGRTLVLFTSYGQLRMVHEAIWQPLRAAGIETLSQGMTGSRGKILNAFRTKGRSVILGTNSFWEGVDLPGDQLCCVVLAKLPFDVPSAPVFAARSEQYDSSFHEYALPRAVLRFKQGFGRLIRTSEDRGVFAVLDDRVETKGYGRVFLEALPSGIPVVRERSGLKR